MKTKAPNPITSLDHCNPSPFIRFYFEFVHLKQLYRQGWLAHGIPAERCESVAEHSFGVAIIAMILTESIFPEVDTLKILQMALIHDFGEVYAGDIVPGDPISTQEKHRLEREAMTKIFGTLPKGENYLDIWEEFESGVSFEARLVQQIDKLEMALQASVYERQQTCNLAEFFQSANSVLSSPELVSILQELEELI